MNEPGMSLDEAKAVVATKVHPRVTEEGLKARISLIEYANPFTCNPQLTICAITMKNGFTVIGKSAPASPLNFDPEVGKRYAYEDAFKQLWALDAYLLKERMLAEASGEL